MRTHATHIRASIIVNHVACVTKIHSMSLCGDLAIFSAFVLFLDCLISHQYKCDNICGRAASNTLRIYHLQWAIFFVQIKVNDEFCMTFNL